MTSIDSFIGTPLLISSVLGVLLFLFLLVIRLRNTFKVSIIFFLMTGILVAGSIYSYVSQHYIYFAFTLILSQFVVLPFLVVKAFDNPEKREEKRAAKKAAELAAERDSDTVSKEVIAEIEEKHQKLLSINKELVLKLSTFFNAENSMENFLEYCNDMLTQKVSADGCVILIADDYDNTLAVKSFKGSFPPPYKLPEDLPHKPIRVETNLRFAQFPTSENIFGEIYTGGEPAFIPDSVKDPRVYQNGPEEFLQCGSYIFVPLKQADTSVGVVALSRDPGKDKFTKDDFDNAVILSDAISTTLKPLYSFLDYAEHTELNAGGTIASKYQKELLPQKLPVLPAISLGCYSNPLEGVCGDFFDIMVSRKDKVSFVMADVAGKGMASLIVMIMIRAILRLAVNTNQTASTILSWANRGICFETAKIDHFASVALINLNTTTREAEIATCGNNPVFIFTASDKSFKQISTPTEPMGVTKDTVYADQKFTLEKGDIIVTCTDGLLESLNENGVQYSIDSLKKVITKNSTSNGKDISNRVKEDLKKYCGAAQQYDDQSLLVVKIQ